MAKKPKSETGAALGGILSERGVSQYSVAKATGASQPFVNQVVNGKRLASAEWLNVIAAALELSEAERVRLHRAAAKDHGFKIDLTKK